MNTVLNATHTDDCDVTYRLPGNPKPSRYSSDWERRLDEWHLLRKAPLYEELAPVRAGRTGELGLRDRLGRHECSRYGEIFGGKRVHRDLRQVVGPGRSVSRLPLIWCHLQPSGRSCCWRLQGSSSRHRPG